MNEEKNKYIYPETELIVVGEDDIICDSGDSDSDDQILFGDEDGL